MPLKRWLLLVVATALAAPTQPIQPQNRAFKLLGARDLHTRQSVSSHRDAAAAKYQRNVLRTRSAIADGRHPATRSDLSKRSIVALNDHIAAGVDILYHGAVSIGTPPQVLSANFDSGSADLWFPTSACSNCGSTPVFDITKSSTFQASSAPFTGIYNAGSCQGVRATDQVSLGGFSTSQPQQFGAVYSVSSDFQDIPSSGVVGLAFPALSSIGGQTLSQSLDISLYGYHVSRHGSGSDELSVGALDGSRFVNGSMQWTPITSQTYYEVRVTGLAIDGKLVTKGLYGAIDTGTTLIMLPGAIATEFWANVPGSQARGDGSWTFDCSWTGTVGLQFDGTSVININREGLSMESVGNSRCLGSIIASDVRDYNNEPMAVIGSYFLKSVYLALSPTRVGFAQLI